MIVWNPKTGPADRYDKRIVQPFGEYLPWRGFFRHLSGLADWAGYIVPGKGTGVVHAAGVPVGVATCWEVIFDRALRDSVRNGAQVLAVPANNANFNQTMSEQQLAFSKVRAVELDRYVVVASNVGISALVTPDGRELVRTDFLRAGLPGQPGAPENDADAGGQVGPDPAGESGRGSCRGPTGRNAAQWMVHGSEPSPVGAGEELRLGSEGESDDDPLGDDDVAEGGNDPDDIDDRAADTEPVTGQKEETYDHRRSGVPGCGRSPHPAHPGDHPHLSTSGRISR